MTLAKITFQSIHILIDWKMQLKVIGNREKSRSKEEKSSIFQNLITNSQEFAQYLFTIPYYFLLVIA